MPRALALRRSLLDAVLVGATAYWMLFLGVRGLWNVGATPRWCVAYLVGLAMHGVLLRRPTRTRASLEAWAIAALLTVPVVLRLERWGEPFSVDRVGGWNTILDGGEVNWALWPYLQLLVWWPTWQVTRAVRWPRVTPSTEGDRP
jgi:hypothetical protein